MARVSLDVRAGVALVRLEDPHRGNAMSGKMADEVVRMFERLEERVDVGAVVVTGSGTTFCAGADLDEVKTGSRDVIERVYRSFIRVRASALPTIAAVNGAAVGAGLNLALACDLRLAGHSARFVSRFTEIGLHPGGGHAWMLIEEVGPQMARAMMLFGHTLDGEAAAEAGLAFTCVDDEDLIPMARSLASAGANVPRALASRVKRTLALIGRTKTYEEAVAIEAEAQLWSAQQPEFRERIAELAQRLRGTSR